MRDRTISIRASDIPPPPPLPYKSSVETINALWDDDPSSWGHSSPLCIQGISIPLVYWQFLVLEYRRWQPDEFWRAHSTDGIRHPTSKILMALRCRRAHVDAVLAEKIRIGLGDRFSDIYSYSNGRRTMTTPGGVARRYRRAQAASKKLGDDARNGV
ncbi:hypothetical protein LXA43DRAFT_905587 [Ganoderma leucocontextum]|nr:hypothetical protein LXA43DRAFT_905587 [Ganoderma leucocontextum]